MQALITNPNEAAIKASRNGGAGGPVVAMDAYAMADYMLAARKPGGGA